MSLLPDSRPPEPPAQATASRAAAAWPRRAWLAAAGGLAALAGVAAWQRVGQVEEPVPGFWGQVFDTPDGGRLALADWQGRPFILNIWATWCPPCVREMPMLAALHAPLQQAGVGLLGLAADQAGPVREFLRGQPVPYPVALAGFSGIALSRELGNAQGGLPFTLSVDGRGHIRHRHLGEARREDLVSWIDDLR